VTVSATLSAYILVSEIWNNIILPFFGVGNHCTTKKSLEIQSICRGKVPLDVVNGEETNTELQVFSIVHSSKQHEIHLSPSDSDPHLDEEIPLDGIWPHCKDISAQTSAPLQRSRCSHSGMTALPATDLNYSNVHCNPTRPKRKLKTSTYTRLS